MRIPEPSSLHGRLHLQPRDARAVYAAGQDLRGVDVTSHPQLACPFVDVQRQFALEMLAHRPQFMIGNTGDAIPQFRLVQVFQPVRTEVALVEQTQAPCQP